MIIVVRDAMPGKKEQHQIFFCGLLKKLKNCFLHFREVRVDQGRDRIKTAHVRIFENSLHCGHIVGRCAQGRNALAVGCYANEQRGFLSHCFELFF